MRDDISGHCVRSSPPPDPIGRDWRGMVWLERSARRSDRGPKALSAWRSDRCVITKRRGPDCPSTPAASLPPTATGVPPVTRRRVPVDGNRSSLR